METPRYSDWFREKAGGRNWVLAARRTAALVRRYGDDVIVITPARNKALQAEFHRAYGHPYDENRRRMYVALIAVRAEQEDSPGKGLTEYTRGLVQGAIAGDLERT